MPLLVAGVRFLGRLLGRASSTSGTSSPTGTRRSKSCERLAARGVWPWWNPFVAFGAPLFADPSFQLAYPPTWLVLLMPPAVYFKLYVVGHCWLAAGRNPWIGSAARGLARPAAILAGITYACSGPLLSSVSLYHHFAGAAWMPAVLWALLDGTRDGNDRCGPASGRGLAVSRRWPGPPTCAHDGPRGPAPHRRWASREPSGPLAGPRPDRGHGPSHGRRPGGHSVAADPGPARRQRTAEPDPATNLHWSSTRGA